MCPMETNAIKWILLDKMKSLFIPDDDRFETSEYKLKRQVT